MTQPTDAPQPPATPAARRGRWPIVAVLGGSLLASAGARQWAEARREAAVPHRGEAASDTSLGSMNSFALGLLLGGLRGPLVMFLWTDSENQKTNKNLDGVNTEIEWIRLLQPEFDTVHLFQIWNKAYNISVQMASRANKYDAVLGALDYAAKVDQQKPEDINIVAQVGQIYFNKLGTSQEKFYYRRRVRDETKARPADQQRAAQAGVQRTRLDPVLDAAGNVLPALTRPVGTPRSEGGETDDGSQMQYLPRFQPYPDGVSTFAVAYNYYKRSEVLFNVVKQRHQSLGDAVIDSQPFLSLRSWCDEASDQGRRHEVQAFGLVGPETAEDMDRATANLPLDHPVADRVALNLAVADYDELAKVFPAAMAENRRDVANFPQHDRLYRLYVEEVKAWTPMAAGDAAYLRAMAAAPADRPPQVAAAAAAYAEAQRLNYLILVGFPEFTDPKFVGPALPPGYALIPGAGQQGLSDLTLQQAAETYTRAEQARVSAKNYYVNHDRDDYEQAIRRGRARYNSLVGRPATAPTTAG